MLEKQQLEIEGLRRKSKIIDENRHDPAALMKALKQHDKEQVKKREELFKQYGTTAEAYYRSYRGTQVQKDRAHYLDANPKIRDQIAANSKTLRRLEAEVWDKLLPFLGPQSLPPSVKKNRP